MENDMRLKDKANGELERKFPVLAGLSEYIHANPELAFNEHKAVESITSLLRQNDFEVQENVGGLETAFTAEYGQGHPVVGVLAEYDALPDLGHGCGHNLIAASAVGAALMVKKVIEDGDVCGRIKLIGTPAEEDGGGKILLMEQGVFQGLDVAMMMHPTSGVTRIAGKCLSSHGLDIRWTGKSAHAESHPEDGVNALDALHIYYTAVACLRQQLTGDIRIAQIVRDGGRNEGMIPEMAAIAVDIVCEDENLESTVEKIKRCAEGAATASGCKVDIRDVTGYLGRRPNHVLEEVFRENFRIIGEPVQEGTPEDFGTTDFGNVTRIMPACNPYVSLLPQRKISNHTEEFKSLAMSSRAMEVIKISSRVMAYSTIDLMTDKAILAEAKREFDVFKVK